MKKTFDFNSFKHVYYLNLHCDDETREARLLARNWPQQMIDDYKNFAKRLLEIADEEYDPPMPTIDTTSTPVTEVAYGIRDWVLRYI
ncbi:hypothetical protein EH198_01145 [Paenibacillus rhizophilus]|uniref:Uncharacterized protein n=2 Tax=Paenibacillus rhizophilus TaxID=1850366 RepID=A0A3N9Q6D9_9BACL|nr:hypothetical protein EH198_01145 [Paenibacillus rhizophilus]